MDKRLRFRTFLLTLASLLVSIGMSGQDTSKSEANFYKFKTDLPVPGQNSSVRKANAPVINSNGSVVEPEGERLDYSLSYYGVSAFGVSENGGIKAEIYYNEEDGAVYVKDIFDPYLGDCFYASGKLIEGDFENGIIEFSTDAPIYYSYGTFLYIAVAEINEDFSGFYLLDDRDTFQFEINKGVITCPDVLALYDGEEAWIVQYDYIYKPVNIDEMNIPEIPANASSSHYFMSAEGIDTGIVKVYNDGDDYYFHNIFGSNLTFKGTLDADGRIKVETPQLVASDNYYIYLSTCRLINGSYTPLSNDCFYFEVDPKTGDIYNETETIGLFSGNKFNYMGLYYSQIEMIKLLPSEEPITVPTTAESKPYALNSGYDYQGNHNAGLLTVARDGNDFYFKRIDLTNDDIIMKGELNPETNEINIDLSQVVGVNGTRFMGLAVAKQNIVVVEDSYDDDYNEIQYVIDDDYSTIAMNYDPATGIITCNDVLAIIDSSRHTVSVKFITPTIFPVNDLAVVPEDATFSDFIFKSNGDSNSASEVKISRYGDTFYFQHPNNMSFIGTLNEDGKIAVEVPQLISSGSRNEGVFLRVGTPDRIGTPEDIDLGYRSWRIFTDDEGVSEILFDFNTQDRTISYDGNFYFVHLNDCTTDLKAANVTYEPYVVGAFTPATPYDLAIAPKSEDYWGGQTRYCFSFVIPCYDVENRYIPYDNITYRLYFDDTVFVFTPEEYPKTFTAEVTDVPFNHPATGEITAAIWNENMRRVYLYNLPAKKLGVQSSYTYNGETKHSDIAYLDVDGMDSGVDQIYTGVLEVKAIEYFDFSGCKVANPGEGLYIMRVTFADGSVKTSKVKF